MFYQRVSSASTLSGYRVALWEILNGRARPWLDEHAAERAHPEARQHRAAPPGEHDQTAAGGRDEAVRQDGSLGPHGSAYRLWISRLSRGKVSRTAAAAGSSTSGAAQRFKAATGTASSAATISAARARIAEVRTPRRPRRMASA